MYTWLARSAICRCGAVSDCTIWLAGESLRERRVGTPTLAVGAGQGRRRLLGGPGWRAAGRQDITQSSLLVYIVGEMSPQKFCILTLNPYLVAIPTVQWAVEARQNLVT